MSADGAPASPVHVLVDLENVQPPAALLDTLVPGFADAWIFHGPNQQRLSRSFKALIGDRATLVPITRTGHNALDFHLSFYLGYVAAKHPQARLVIIANDKGYEPMIEHAVALGFEVRREGYGVPSTLVSKKPSVKKPDVKRQAAKKTAGKKTSAKPPALKAPAVKTASAKKAGAMKSASKAAGAPAAVPVAKKASASQEKVEPALRAAASLNAKGSEPSASEARLRRIANAFGKMGDERPQKKSSFLRHVAAMLGEGSSDERLRQAVAYLTQSGLVQIDGEKVGYRTKKK